MNGKTWTNRYGRTFLIRGELSTEDLRHGIDFLERTWERIKDRPGVRLLALATRLSRPPPEPPAGRLPDIYPYGEARFEADLEAWLDSVESPTIEQVWPVIKTMREEFASRGSELADADEVELVRSVVDATASLNHAREALVARAAETVSAGDRYRVFRVTRPEDPPSQWPRCMDRDWPSKAEALNAIDSLAHCHPKERGTYKVFDMQEERVVATREIR